MIKKNVSRKTIVLTVLLAMTTALTTLAADQPEARAQKAKIITLNFDDGPRSAILENNLLPVLKKHKAPGTFFMEGAIVVAYEALVGRMHNEGFEIESHAWAHENFKKAYGRNNNRNDIDRTGIKASLDRTAKVIERTCGRKPLFFRPPFWEITDEMTSFISGLGYTVMRSDNPDINTEDYDFTARHRSASELTAHVKKLIANREKQNIFRHVLVFHELKLTAEALDVLIPYFQAQGYTFVRLDDFYNSIRVYPTK